MTLNDVMLMTKLKRGTYLLTGLLALFDLLLHPLFIPNDNNDKVMCILCMYIYIYICFSPHLFHSPPPLFVFPRPPRPSASVEIQQFVEQIVTINVIYLKR